MRAADEGPVRVPASAEPGAADAEEADVVGYWIPTVRLQTSLHNRCDASRDGQYTLSQIAGPGLLPELLKWIFGRFFKLACVCPSL